MAKHTRPYGDAESTSFPKMGDEELTSHVVNISGNRSPYTMPVQKKGPTNDGDPSMGTANARSANLIHEANGPRCRTVETINYENTPEKNATGRNLRIMPSKAGIQDFSGGMNNSNSGEVI